MLNGSDMGSHADNGDIFKVNANEYSAGRVGYVALRTTVGRLFYNKDEKISL